MTTLRQVRQQKTVFLEAFAESANVSKSAAKAGCPRTNVYRWLDEDPEFAAAYAEAERIGTGVLEDEAVRRAVQGVDKPVFYQGDVAGFIREYSDTLLIFLLKARNPEKYRETGTQVSIDARQQMLVVAEGRLLGSGDTSTD